VAATAVASTRPDVLTGGRGGVGLCPLQTGRARRTSTRSAAAAPRTPPSPRPHSGAGWPATARRSATSRPAWRVPARWAPVRRTCRSPAGPAWLASSRPGPSSEAARAGQRH